MIMSLRCNLSPTFIWICHFFMSSIMELYQAHGLIVICAQVTDVTRSPYEKDYTTADH